MSRSEIRLSVQALERIDQICLEFERQCKSGDPPRIDDYLGAFELHEQNSILTELVLLEVDYLADQGKFPRVDEYTARFPEHESAIERAFSMMAKTSRQGSDPILLPGSSISNEPVTLAQPGLDRYVLHEEIGAGAFATVFRASDETLKRDVAIKIPHPSNKYTYDINRFLTEARMLAKLDHPAIVPIYDTGQMDDERIFIVTKLIAGKNLETKLAQGPIAVDLVLDIVSQTAIALDHAHRRGLIHRDLKPSNILLDARSQVFITDFGLALDIDSPTVERFVGTPAYMSPEQAGGESHLVDHRSDIFSLGAILYQMLTGQRPFQGEGTRELLEQVKLCQLISPTRINPAIPPELERICLKAMSAQIIQRYGIAKDIATEIEQFKNRSASSVDESSPASCSLIPKGLNSFDGYDAESFIQLLPGSRDRNGLPESVRYWKRRIESREPEATFRVGLLSGPSGSGKSSLIKAGLIPRLASNIQCIFVQSDSFSTDERLLNKLVTSYPALQGCRSLVEATSQLRQRDDSTKCLIVLDQFEQWLSQHGTSDSLLPALRQCDGEHLQCLLVVRDDFGMATTRFMQRLEASIEQNRNFASVDLFTVEHAKHVLTLFASALGKWNADQPAGRLTNDQTQFVNSAIECLAEDDRVIAVKLSLFAELIRDREWNQKTIDSFGSLTDLGVAFLDEHLGAKAKHPIAKRHRVAIEQLLEALLPEESGQIKGHSILASTLASRIDMNKETFQFSELLNFLEQQLRLIAKSDEAQLDASVDESNQPIPTEQADQQTSPSPEVSFQLTHDFLVPSMRQWLTEQQRSTRRGRLNLRLQHLSAWWQNEPGKRRLPSLVEWTQIRALVARHRWSEPQRKMMKSADHYYLLRIALTLLIAAVVFLGIREFSGRMRATQVVAQIETSESSTLPGLLNKLPGLKRWAAPMLIRSVESTPPKSRSRLNSLMAVYTFDSSVAKELTNELLELEPRELATASQRLYSKRESLVPFVVQQVDSAGLAPARRLRAICLLARFSPQHDFFKQPQDETVAVLLGQIAADIPVFVEMLTPIAASLKASLSEYYRDTANPDAQQLSAGVLAGFCRQDTPEMMELVDSANVDQMKVLLPFLHSHKQQILPTLVHSWNGYLSSIPVTRVIVPLEMRRRFGMLYGQGRDWVMASRVPENEFDRLNQTLEKTGLTAAFKEAYTAGGDPYLVAIWSSDEAKQETSFPRSADKLLDARSSIESGVTIEAIHDSANGSVHRLEYFVDQGLAVSPDVKKLLSQFDWIQQSRHSNRPRSGLVKIEQVDITLPQIPFSELKAFTIEAWVDQWNGPILSQGHNRDGESSLWFGVESRRNKPINFGWTSKNGTQRFANSIVLPERQELNHVALVFDNRRQKFFINGEMISNIEADPPGQCPPFRVLWLGKRFNEAQKEIARGNGNLISLRVSNVARYDGVFHPPSELERDSKTLLKLGIARPITSSRATTTKQRTQSVRITGIDSDHLMTMATSLSNNSYRPVRLGRLISEADRQTQRQRWSIEWKRNRKLEMNGAAYSLLANEATALWELENSELILPALDSSENNALRTLVILNLARTGCRPEQILTELQKPQPAAVRQALVMSMSKASNQTFPISSRKKWLPFFVNLYRSDADVGVRSAVGLLLDQWGTPAIRKQVDRELANSDSASVNGNWLYTSQRQMMAIIDNPVLADLVIGRGLDRNVAKRFAIAIFETTNQQFAEFEKSQNVAQSVPPTQRPDGYFDLPKRSVSWFRAAAFCNWLSEQEGIPRDQWCFVANGELLGLAPNYLERTGYRLPTIDEWELACAADSQTAFYFGSNQKLLKHFAWSVENSNSNVHPVGRLLPNTFGLFDMHGNLREWTIESLSNTMPTKDENGTVCGGGYGHPSHLMTKSMSRHPSELNGRSGSNNGFRIVRTLD